MAKNWDEMDPWQQEKEVRKLGEQMGVNRDDFQEEDTGSQGHFDRDKYFEAISKSMNNNYSVRSGLEAANRYGAEGAPDYKSISDIGEAYETHKYLKSVHEDELKSGKEFKSRRHYGAVSRYLNDKDREHFKQGFTDDLSAMKDTLSSQDDQQSTASSEPAELSEKLHGARNRIASPRTNIYESNNEEVSTTDEVNDATQNFLADRTFDVKTGLNLKPKASNISNALKLTGVNGLA